MRRMSAGIRNPCGYNNRSERSRASSEPLPARRAGRINHYAVRPARAGHGVTPHSQLEAISLSLSLIFFWLRLRPSLAPHLIAWAGGPADCWAGRGIWLESLSIYMNKREVQYHRGTQDGLNGSGMFCDASESREAVRLQAAGRHTRTDTLTFYWPEA